MIETVFIEVRMPSGCGFGAASDGASVFMPKSVLQDRQPGEQITVRLLPNAEGKTSSAKWRAVPPPPEAGQ